MTMLVDVSSVNRRLHFSRYRTDLVTYGSRLHVCIIKCKIRRVQPSTCTIH